MKQFAFILGIALVLTSCNSGAKKTGDYTYDCYVEYQSQYNQFLSKEEVNEVTPIGEKDLKEESKKGESGYYRLSWLSGRPDTVIIENDEKIEIKDRDFVEIGHLELAPLGSEMNQISNEFDETHKNISDEALKQIEMNVENSAYQIKEIGWDAPSAAEIMRWNHIGALGDSAWFRWDFNEGGELVVLSKLTQFKIRLKISEDPKRNMEVAMKLASIALNKCAQPE